MPVKLDNVTFERFRTFRKFRVHGIALRAQGRGEGVPVAVTMA